MTGENDKTAQVSQNDVGKKDPARDTDPAMTRAASPQTGARIVCIAGLVKGKEFPLNEGILMIGRKEGLPLTLDDGMVSRQHAEISYENGRYVVRDLGSRNGTKVNGRRIREKGLRNGSKIKIGRTEFKFVAGQEGGQMALVPGYMIDLILRRPLLSVLLIVIAVLSVIAFYPQSPRQTEGTGGKPPQTESGTSLQQAREEMASGNFSVAREILYQIMAARPNDMEAQALMKKAEQEEANVQFIKESEGLASQGNVPEAIGLLKKVPQGSDAFKRAQDNIADLKKSTTEPLMKEAKEFLRQKQWEEARKKLETVLEKDPDNTLAVDLLDLLISWETPPPVQDKKGTKGGKTENQSTPVRLGNRTPAGSQTPDKDPMVLYEQGNLEGAIRLWQSEARAEGDTGVREKFVLATSIKKYMAQAEGETRDRQRDAAIQSLTKAMSFHEKISGGRGGAIGEKIGISLALAISDKGEESITQGRFPEAYTSFRQALDVHPGDVKALEGIKRLEKKAEEIYRQAYVLEKVNSEEAVEKYRQILAMVPPDNEYFVKAQEKVTQHRK